jgi:hypothetical protein
VSRLGRGKRCTIETLLADTSRAERRTRRRFHHLHEIVRCGSPKLAVSCISRGRGRRAPSLSSCSSPCRTRDDRRSARTMPESASHQEVNGLNVALVEAGEPGEGHRDRVHHAVRVVGVGTDVVGWDAAPALRPLPAGVVPVSQAEEHALPRTGPVLRRAAGTRPQPADAQPPAGEASARRTTGRPICFGAVDPRRARRLREARAGPRGAMCINPATARRATVSLAEWPRNRSTAAVQPWFRRGAAGTSRPKGGLQ